MYKAQEIIEEYHLDLLKPGEISQAVAVAGAELPEIPGYKLFLDWSNFGTAYSQRCWFYIKEEK